ncbi:MAG: cupin domain-containing protein [Candidatus Omnitrophica bacterium]|jgi:uncharacterized cupin superfamily protein|nr:cupin domain-containing protein [Candidatus Omnitrophota bacterium]
MREIEVSQPSEDEIQKLDIGKWSPWECQPSQFQRTYDKEEWFFLIEGKAVIRTEKGGEIIITKGDLVKLPKGIVCAWQVVESIRKVYTFK